MLKRLGNTTINIDPDTLKAGHYTVTMPDGKAVRIPRAVADELPAPPGRPALSDDERLQRRWVSMPGHYWRRIDEQPDKARIVIMRAIEQYLGL